MIGTFSTYCGHMLVVCLVSCVLCLSPRVPDAPDFQPLCTLVLCVSPLQRARRAAGVHYVEVLGLCISCCSAVMVHAAAPHLERSNWRGLSSGPPVAWS